MFVSRKLLKHSLFWLPAGGFLYSLHSNNYDLGSVGAIRFGRAAVTVSTELLHHSMNSEGHIFKFSVINLLVLLNRILDQNIPVMIWSQVEEQQSISLHSSW